MWTSGDIAKLRRSNPQKYASYRSCRVCHLWFPARNLQRHTKACSRRQREAREKSRAKGLAQLKKEIG
jgi:hypothetical protein